MLKINTWYIATDGLQYAISKQPHAEYFKKYAYVILCGIIVDGEDRNVRYVRSAKDLSNAREGLKQCLKSK